MSDIKVKVSTKQGQIIGYFVNPKIDHLCQHDYEISGHFVNEEGQTFEKIDFNPEVVPYILDVSNIPGLDFKSLENAFVHRGRQPVVMTAIRPH